MKSRRGGKKERKKKRASRRRNGDGVGGARLGSGRTKETEGTSGRREGRSY